MFRYLAVLVVALYLTDRALGMLLTRRAINELGDVVGRKADPLGYWVLTGLWVASAIAAIAGVLVLTYFAVAGIGPYRAKPFLSNDLTWQFALILVPGSWLSFKILRGWIDWVRSRGSRDAP